MAHCHHPGRKLRSVRRYVLISAFTETPGHGNEAGVVLDAAGMSNSDMQRAAARIGAPESVFVTQREGGVVWVRYFTPTQEIEFCGHATIALGLMLAQRGQWDGAGVQLETQVGRIPLELEQDGTQLPHIWMWQRELELRPLDRNLRGPLAAALGIDARLIHRGLPMVSASTGLWSAFVPLLDSFILDHLEPDMAAIRDLSSELGVSGLHPYAPMGPRTYAARDFAPLVGIPEDPVTGSASGALIALLGASGALPRTGNRAEGVCYQGHAMGSPGEVRVELTFSQERVAGVRVGGCAVVEREGQLD